ncbi:MAG: sulfite exporter TauE/SafE family protein [Pseudomonadota bacterium]
MPEGLAVTFELPGVWAVLASVAAAGLVYGFSGFGAALVYTPVAMLFIPAEVAIAAFSLSSLVSLFTVFPAAAQEADLKATGLMILAAIVATPLGVRALAVADPDVVRSVVAVIVLVTLTALVLGWRMTTKPTATRRVGIGAAAGIMGGMTGLAGPIVILFQLAGGDAAQRSRANLIIFLTVTSISFVPQLWLQGLLTPEALWLGLLLMPVYAVATRLGKALFRPEQELIYRRFAYLVIAVAGLAALPIWR